VALLEGELSGAHQDQEVAVENSCGLSNAMAEAEWQWEESEWERLEQFEELKLL
jgi:hypothetical protein